MKYWLIMFLITYNSITTLELLKIKLAEDAFIDSDQGVHYTSPTYYKKVKELKLGQSMLRR